MFIKSYAVIDPMALILSERAYLVWVEKNHPHVPRLANIQEMMTALNPEEKKFALARAQQMAAYSKAVEAALG